MEVQVWPSTVFFFYYYYFFCGVAKGMLNLITRVKREAAIL